MKHSDPRDRRAAMPARHPGAGPSAGDRMIVDRFDVLYEDGAASGRVMAICLHPFPIGHAFRARYLDKALGHIARRDEVWVTRGGEIADWYRANYLKP